MIVPYSSIKREKNEKNIIVKIPNGGLIVPKISQAK